MQREISPHRRHFERLGAGRALGHRQSALDERPRRLDVGDPVVLGAQRPQFLPRRSSFVASRVLDEADQVGRQASRADSRL